MRCCSDNTTRQLGVLKLFILMNLKSTLLLKKLKIKTPIYILRADRIKRKNNYVTYENASKTLLDKFVANLPLWNQDGDGWITIRLLLLQSNLAGLMSIGSDLVTQFFSSKLKLWVRNLTGCSPSWVKWTINWVTFLFSTQRHERVRRLPGKPEMFVTLTLDEDGRPGSNCGGFTPITSPRYLQTGTP